MCVVLHRLGEAVVQTARGYRPMFKDGFATDEPGREPLGLGRLRGRGPPSGGVAKGVRAPVPSAL
jgi:hypothetical protein